MAHLQDGSIFMNQLRDSLNEALILEAEPMIKRSVDEFERALRASLAGRVISMLQTSYSMERDGQFLQIRVAQSPTKGATQ